jgi:hypothetical protein
MKLKNNSESSSGRQNKDARSEGGMKMKDYV